MNFVIVKFPIILISIAYSLGILLSNSKLEINDNLSIALVSFILISLPIIEKLLKGRNKFKTFLLLASVFVISFIFNSSRIHNHNPVGTSTIKTEITISRLFNSYPNYQNCIAKDVYTSRKYLTVIPIVDSNNYKIGTKLFVKAKIEPLNGLVIPNNFNFSQYLERKNVNSKMLVGNYIETTNKHSISRTIEDKIDESRLSESSKSLMKALVLGRKDGVSDKLMASFSDSGIMHLLALSGLHIGILTIILTFLLRPLKLLKRGKLIRSIVVVGLLWYYSYITGFSSSIIRATIMFSIIVIGNGLRREVNIFNSLAIAALVLLIINPYYLFDVGFQLGFSAVIGIVWLFPMFAKLWRPKYKVVKYIWSLLLVSISAQIATFPFTIFYFHKFSGLFFVANIIEIPLITVLLALSYLVISLLMFGIEFDFLVFGYDKLVSIIEWVSIEISRMKSFIFYDIFIDKLEIVLLFFLIISITVFFQSKKVKYLYIGLISVISIQISVFIQKLETSKNNVLMMAKNEIILQKGNKYTTNTNEGAKLFYNYAKANKLKQSDSILDNVFYFNDNYYWKIDKNFKYNPILYPHTIIVGRKSKSNPEMIVNDKTQSVIYSGYENSSSKSRWEYFCSRKNIKFDDVNNMLYYRKY